MQNYAPWTIVPVGTKVVRTQVSSYLKVWEVYIISYTDDSFVRVEGSNEFFNINFFAPYIEEEVKKEAYSLPAYITLKFIPWVSKGSVIVNGIPKGKWITVIQNDTKFPEKLSIDHEDNVRWLLKEHPEDFKKIN